MAKTEHTYDALRDKIVSEQFLKQCHEKLAIFLKERGCQGLDKLAEATDHYLEAQGLTNLGKYKEEKDSSKPLGLAKIPAHRIEKRKPQCFLCNKLGHRAAVRWSNSKGPKQNANFCWKCRDNGHKAEACPNKKSDVGGKASCSVMHCNRPEDLGSNACLSKQYPVGTARTKGTEVQAEDMPTATGLLEGHPVTVLRDSGCNSVIVKRSLVPDGKLTGKSRMLYLLDRTVRCLPEAEVDIDSPYFRGRVTATCMENPLYDVVLGNVVGVRDVSAPDINWKAEQYAPTQKEEPAPETSNESHSSLTSQPTGTKTPSFLAAMDPKDKQLEGAAGRLPVATVNPVDIHPEELRTKQREDPSLNGCFEAVGREVVSRAADVKFVLTNGILFRHYRLPSAKQMEQLIVPSNLRSFVLKMAHEGILSGHQGIKRTTDRVLEEFYWPGVQGDVTRFVKSCDICQRTVPKHLVGRVPLGSMPVIATPFQRVAIDIVGPLAPISEKGNRYVLTMVDFATRYPDAIALPSIETEKVAQALLEMFSRVGFPREIITDRGRSFLSGLMKEFSRLLSFRQLPTTPYHPMANGLVERFNGTLKQMIRRMCQECPKSWDRYLALLLFAYRELPQTSLGFAPFDLLYGRYVRGPMAILKELWTGERIDDETKTSYGYMIDLRQRLEETCRMAQEHLTKAKAVQKRYYDKKARVRQLSVGDKVLLLLPSDANKLILTWKGPFAVLERRNDVDYVIDLGTRTSLFHINMLKKYEKRPLTDQTPQRASAAFQHEEVEEEDVPVLTLHQKETYRDVKVSEELTSDQRTQVATLLAAHQGSLSDVPGKTDLVECKLKLTTDTPVQVNQYPIPFSLQEAVESEIQQMLQQGIIEPSESPYQSPVVVAKKKDKSMRLCIDFRQLNRALISDNEPIPRVDMMFAQLGRSRYFSKFDFSKGYWQVPMHEEAKPMTAFSSRLGLYQFRVMPFGIKTAPAIFTRLMRKVVQGLPKVYHYFDDVLIATENWEEHLEALELFFRRVKDEGLTIRPTKSEVGFSSVKFLGHIVGHGLLRPQVETLEKVQAAEQPETKKEVRSFLGLTGYYRDFVPQYAEISHPLTELTRKRAPNRVNWSKKEQEAFDKLREQLSKEPILKAPEFSKPFVLRTDASNTSVGAVLMQRHDHVLHPVACASRRLLPREAGYSTIERECLALIMGS
ncbi:uncharacterized protein ISCGN_020955 [Ixodes scapularis]